MANRVDGSLNNLVQGVSQQAPRDRLPGQSTEQLNCVSDPVRGLSRRAPSVFIQELTSAIHDAQAFIHTYDRGDDEKYILLFTDGAVQVYDIDGNAKVVGGGAQTYLDTTDAQADLTVHTIGDFTLISNQQAVPALNSTNALNTKLIRNGALFTLDRPGSYSQVFSITVDGTTVSYTIPDENGAANVNFQTWGVHKIMQGLHDGFTKAGYSKEIVDNTLHIYKTDTTLVTPITASVESDNAGLAVMSHAATTPIGLPNLVPHGLVIKITGGTSVVDDFFMRSVHNDTDAFTGALNSSLAEGHWIECANPDDLNEIDPVTMPHALVRMPNGDFHYGPLDGVDRVDAGTNVVENPLWAERLTGDVLTNANPSFIGQAINGITSFQGRLVFLAGENLIASDVEDLFKFWKKSATILVDSDRIDITANSDKVAILRRAVQHNRNLVVFSDNAQFVIPGRTAFKPGTAALTQTTVFEADMQADPLANGQNILFGINYGKFAGIREFFTDSEFDTDNAEPITRHVERYLPGRLKNLAGSTDYNAVVATTDGSPLVFLYQYLWAGKNKVQSAWSQWSFTDTVVHTFFVQSLLYLVKRTAGNVYYLTTLDTRDVPPTGLDANVYLDKQVALVATTTATLPADYIEDATLIAVQGDGCPNPGLRIIITDNTTGTLTLAEDMLGGTIHVGTAYSSRYVPTQYFIKDRNGVPVGTGSLRIQQFYMTFVDTGSLEVFADTKFSGTFQLLDYTGRSVNAQDNLIGSQPIVDDTIPVAFRFKADEADLRVESNSHLPFRLTDIEWRGKFTKRGKRL